MIFADWGAGCKQFFEILRVSSPPELMCLLAGGEGTWTRRLARVRGSRFRRRGDGWVRCLIQFQLAAILTHHVRTGPFHRGTMDMCTSVRACSAAMRASMRASFSLIW